MIADFGRKDTGAKNVKICRSKGNLVRILDKFFGKLYPILQLNLNSFIPPHKLVAR